MGSSSPHTVQARRYAVLLRQLATLPSADEVGSAPRTLRRALVVRSLRDSARFAVSAVGAAGGGRPPPPPVLAEVLPLLALQPLEECKHESKEQVKEESKVEIKQEVQSASLSRSELEVSWRLLLLLLSHLLQLLVAEGASDALLDSDLLHRSSRALKRKHKRWINEVSPGVEASDDCGFFAYAELLHTQLCNRPSMHGGGGGGHSAAARAAEKETLITLD